MPRFIAYGSLKTGKYNHAAFDLTLVKKVERIDKFQMYSLGAYPAIKNEDGAYFEEAEILEVNNELDWERIKRMEFGAGYEMQMIMVEGEELPIFVHKYNLDEYEKIQKF